MGVEVRPYGVACNIECPYCYQNHQRKAGNYKKPLNFDAMIESIDKEGRPFTIFGGEPLLFDLPKLEKLLEYGLNKFGVNSIQSNGILINDEHIRLFKKYKVNIGISVDGPEELNDLRWAGNETRTRETTQATHQAIKKLCENGLAPGLIITLHRKNGSAEKISKLCEWILSLDDIGVQSIRVHLLEAEDEMIKREYGLTQEENIKALNAIMALETKLKHIKFDIDTEIRSLLLGDDHVAACTWRACDPYTTAAVRGIEGDGSSSNCGRTNKEGIDFMKSETDGYERYLSLYNTPQEDGGCKDCRFFLMCKGQCPGTAIDGDWRNRSEDCEVWKSLFSQMESALIAEGKVPLSKHPLRRQVEKQMLEGWAGGQNKDLKSICSELSIY